MKKLMLISALLLVVGCSKETNTKLLCECMASTCFNDEMSVVVNESIKLFTAGVIGNLTNIRFTETEIYGEYPNLNGEWNNLDDGKWRYTIDRVSLELIKRFDANEQPMSRYWPKTLSVYQCKIVDGI